MGGVIFLFRLGFQYNKDMNRECNCTKSFETVSEYPCTQPACIRRKQPDCMATAVIPTITVETADGILNLADCFVHTTSTNTTYYIDDKHRVVTVWAGPVEVAAYDLSSNPLGLRSQDCYTTVNGVYSHVYFDRQGIAHIVGKEE